MRSGESGGVIDHRILHPSAVSERAACSWHSAALIRYSFAELTSFSLLADVLIAAGEGNDSNGPLTLGNEHDAARALIALQISDYLLAESQRRIIVAQPHAAEAVRSAALVQDEMVMAHVGSRSE